MSKIKQISAYEILDSRGNPTIEVEVTLENGITARAAVPSGASTGEREALELRDGDKSRYLGKGVTKATENVNKIIAPVLFGISVLKQQEIDNKMIKLDGTQNKSFLGANAILGVSLAVCRAGSLLTELPLYEYIRKCYNLPYKDYIFPVPMMNIINGGAHADNNLDIQEFMIIPSPKEKRFSAALQIGVEVFHTLKSILKKKGYKTSVGDEGGFAPDIKYENTSSNISAIEVILEAINSAGYIPGKDVYLGLDVAASELYDNNKYNFTKEGTVRSTEEVIALYSNIVDKYPVISIEDGLAESDWSGWKIMTQKLGKKIQLVGDDIFVTNAKIFEEGIKQGIATAILIKLNQIGTLTEAIETVQMAYENNYKAIISHRSGETEDTFIADLCIALNTGQIKTGSASRTDRICKYNQLLRIEHFLGDKAKFCSI